MLNKVIEKLLIEQDKYKNQLSMYEIQEQELSNEMRTLQPYIVTYMFRRTA